MWWSKHRDKKQFAYLCEKDSHMAAWILTQYIKGSNSKSDIGVIVAASIDYINQMDSSTVDHWKIMYKMRDKE